MKLPDRLRLSPEWAPYVFISPFVALFLIFTFPLVADLEESLLDVVDELPE